MVDINYVTTNPLNRDKILEAAIEGIQNTIAAIPKDTTSAAIIEAMTYLSSIGGGVVQLEAKDYVISQNIPLIQV